jgi:ATP-dependent helicase IRC3
MISLRNYQIQSLEAVSSNLENGVRRQVLHLPTASGKTLIFASLIAGAINSDLSTRALILAFSCDLLTQARDKLHMVAPGLDIGLVDTNNKEFDRQVVISSVQSARQPSNLEKLQARGFTIAICDECHHFASDSARLVLNELGFSKEGCEDGNRLLVGFSATPFRSDGRGLGEIFDRIVYHKKIGEMIAEGYLCAPKGHKVLTDLDLSKVSIEGGDYSSVALSKVMNTDQINELVVRSYMEKAVGRKTIAFCTSIEHSVKLAEWFKRFGIVSEAIHSELSAADRDALKKRFRNGDIEVLTNPLMLTEGYDEPSISAVIVARPTRSTGLYQQMAGRGLRLFPNKADCIVLDFGDHAHSLCNVAVLLGDSTDDGPEEKPRRNEKIEELVRTLPSNIDPKLKRAILEIDLLGDSFTWQKDTDGSYFLKGAGDTTLRLIKRKEDNYDAVLFNLKGSRTIASGLNFEYSFAAAEDFARSNRSLFAVSDLDANWRKLPISEKQKVIFQSGGFKNGIDGLNRGQAATIISSGVLRKMKVKSTNLRILNKSHG